MNKTREKNQIMFGIGVVLVIAWLAASPNKEAYCGGPFYYVFWLAACYVFGLAAALIILMRIKWCVTEN